MNRPIPLDPDLPALGELLPPKGAPEVVARAVSEMTGTRCDPDQARVEYFEYRPRKHCRILWSIPAPTGKPYLVSGNVFGDSGGERVIRRRSFQRLASAAAALTSGGRRCYDYLSEQRLLLQLFPLDHKVPGLVRVSCTDWMRGTIARFCRVSPEQVKVIQSDVAAYKPCRRCSWRFAMEAPRPLRAFAKMFPDQRAQALAQTLRELRSQFKNAGVPWDVPEPLSCSAEGDMLLLEDVDGASPPKELVVRATIDPNARRALLKLVASAADGLHAFQRLKVRGLLPRGPDILMKKLAKDSESPEQLAQVAPDLAELIRTSVVRLTSEAARMAPESVRLGHGSFRHTHFLLRSDRPVLVDLEGLCLRGVSADAGDFLAYLDWVGCRQPQYGSLLEECSAIFLMGLKGLPDLSPRWLSWHRAAAQVKWALRTFASLAPSWVEISERLVRLSGQALPMPCSRAGISGARASAPGARRRKIAARRLIP